MAALQVPGLKQPHVEGPDEAFLVVEVPVGGGSVGLGRRPRYWICLEGGSGQGLLNLVSRGALADGGPRRSRRPRRRLGHDALINAPPLQPRDSSGLLLRFSPSRRTANLLSELAGELVGIISGST